MALLNQSTRHLDVKEYTVFKAKAAQSWLVDYITAIKNGQFHPFTQLERLVRQATRNEPWGPTGTMLNRLAEDSQDVDSCRIIMAVLQARLNAPPLKWRNAYKALCVLEYLLRNGSHMCVRIAETDVRPKLQELQTFESTSTDGQDMGLNVRMRSQAICALLADEGRLTQERAQAAQRKRQYTGYARDDLAQPQQFRTLSEISLPPGPDGSLPSPLRRTRSAGRLSEADPGDDISVAPTPRAPVPDAARPRRNAGETKGVTLEENKKHLAALRRLLALPENRTCADCGGAGAGARPTWASINCGAFICMRCAGIHRGLGVHISQVRSCTLDTWLPEQVDFMARTGNQLANAYREARLNPADRPSTNPLELESFIRRKYNGDFAEGDWPPPDSQEPLRTSRTQPFTMAVARQTSGLASETFGHNASQLEASLRASGQSVGSGYAPRGMEDDRFSVNASFSYQHSPARSQAAASPQQLAIRTRAADQPQRELSPSQPAERPADLPDLMQFADSPLAAPSQAAARPPTQAAQQPRSSAAQLEAIQELEVGMHLLDDAYLSSPELHRPPEASPHSHWQVGPSYQAYMPSHTTSGGQPGQWHSPDSPAALNFDSSATWSPQAGRSAASGSLPAPANGHAPAPGFPSMPAPAAPPQLPSRAPQAALGPLAQGLGQAVQPAGTGQKSGGVTPPHSFSMTASPPLGPSRGTSQQEPSDTQALLLDLVQAAMRSMAVAPAQQDSLLQKPPPAIPSLKELRSQRSSADGSQPFRLS